MFLCVSLCEEGWEGKYELERTLRKKGRREGPCITAVTSHLDQLQRKAEAIQQLDSKIQSIMEEPSDIEGDVLDSLDILDTLIERMTRLKRYLEKARATTVTYLLLFICTEQSALLVCSGKEKNKTKNSSNLTYSKPIVRLITS